MNNASAVCKGEGRTDVGEDAVGFADREAVVRDCVFQCSTTKPTHRQIGAVRISPVVVERNDVGVFEARNELRFDLEETDESQVVRVLRSDDLDRDFATDGRLIGTVDNTKRTRADLLAQFITRETPRLHRERKGRQLRTQRWEVALETIDDELVHRTSLP